MDKGKSVFNIFEEDKEENGSPDTPIIIINHGRIENLIIGYQSPNLEPKKSKEKEKYLLEELKLRMKELLVKLKPKELIKKITRILWILIIILTLIAS